MADQATAEDKISFLKDFYGDLLFRGGMRDALLNVASERSLSDKVFEYEYDYEGTVGLEITMASPLKFLAKVKRKRICLSGIIS